MSAKRDAMQFPFSPRFERLLDLAIEEDLPHGDITSESIFGPSDAATARFLAKSRLVICGLPVIMPVFRRFPHAATFTPFVEEGEECEPGTVLGEAGGSVLTLLGAERTCLNFLQHLSAIATVSRRLHKLAGGRIEVVDTRKTLPGWRDLQKYAVSVGGCRNHRACLSSGVLIKDNHIDACGSVAEAVARVRRRVAHGMKIEVEVRSEAEVQEAIQAGAEILLLDNMGVEEIRRICSIYRGRARFEVSGGITEETLDAVAGTGADLVSLGALTHTVRAADISMKIRVNP